MSSEIPEEGRRRRQHGRDPRNGRLYAEGCAGASGQGKAFAYFKQAEAAGNQAGVIKQAQLLEQTKDTSPADAAAYETCFAA